METSRAKPHALVTVIVLLVGVVGFWKAAPASASGLTAVPQATVVDGIVTFPSRAAMRPRIGGLRLAGIQAQATKQLPMAFVRGTQAQIDSALRPGVAERFYPDEPIEYHSAESNRAIGVDAVQALGFTGKGMQVAVVDTGIDATHPDLADHVVHNVKIFGPEDAGQPADSPPGSIVVAADEGPYSNTDESGHGTFVAGVVAADGTTDPDHVGVAPDADLIGYSVGGAAGMRTIIAAFDHILDHPKWGIDVVNNSWGNAKLGLLDPASPINVATKALADEGIVVVFAAGNRGKDQTEMTLSPHGAAPWAISVASSTVAGARSDFSSNGLIMDNSELAPVDGHVRFTGDRIGLYHPTITAPGSRIESSCTVLYACAPGGTATGQGTSFAAPHVSGLAALLRQARPELSVAQLRQTLEATAVPTATGSPFWQVGYGIVDAPSALALVRSKNFKTALKKEHRADEARVLAERDWRVLTSDLWTWTPPPLAVGHTPERHELTLPVAPGADALKVAISTYDPSMTGEYVVTVRDAKGQEIGRTEARSGGFAPIASVLIDLRGMSPAYGDWTLSVEPAVAVNDEGDKQGAKVLVQAALLEAQVAVVAPEDDPVESGFVANGTLPLAFTPDPRRTTGAVSPEGCEIEPGAPQGILAPPPPMGPCHSGTTVDAAAEFTSAPLEQRLVVGGKTTLVVHTTIPAPLDPGVRIFMKYELAEVTAGGDSRPLLSEQVIAERHGRNEFVLNLPVSAVAAGSRLRARVSIVNLQHAAATFLFGGQRYGDAGITVTTGHFATPTVK